MSKQQLLGLFGVESLVVIYERYSILMSWTNSVEMDAVTLGLGRIMPFDCES